MQLIAIALIQGMLYGKNGSITVLIPKKCAILLQIRYRMVELWGVGYA